MSERRIDAFLQLVRQAPEREDVFNPWWQVDAEHEIDSSGPEIRRRHLRHYLSERFGRARFVLLAEALGYQGGHFSGVPMTSERILLGHLAGKGVRPEHVFSGCQPRRTSKPALRPQGFTEPTATIVWQTVLAVGLDPRKVILWNAYPWHPFQPARGKLSNRTPSTSEFLEVAETSRRLLAIFDAPYIIAVGSKAAAQLDHMGIDVAARLRHPAQGGATAFRDGMREFIEAHDGS